MMIRIILICLVIFSNEIYGLRRRCINTGILFPDKISQSSIIIYGESLGKRIYIETDTELLFNITFRVDCIFKGEKIQNHVEITDAGIKNNRTACQWLDPGKFYVVFLDKSILNESVFYPMDFQERLVDDITYELLERTCRLTRRPPLNSISNNCPNVSMAEFCPIDDNGIKIMPKSKNFDDEKSILKTSFNNINQFPFQSNVTITNDRPLVNHIGDNPRSHASLSKLISIKILILALYITMFI